MKNLTVLKLFLALGIVAAIGGGATLIEKHVQSIETFFGVGELQSFNPSSDRDRHFDDTAYPSTAGVAYRTAMTSPNASTPNARHKTSERIISNLTLDAFSDVSNVDYAHKRNRENIEIQSGLDGLIAASGTTLRAAAANDIAPVAMSTYEPFSTGTTPSFAPSATSAGGDPGTDPTGPPLPLGDAALALLFLVAGYGIVRAIKL